MALDAKGSAPFLTKVVKKMAFRKNWRSTKREQDRIVQYIANQTKDASFNYIVTRPSAAFIWDRPSRKKLAASKSVCNIVFIIQEVFIRCILRDNRVSNVLVFASLWFHNCYYCSNQAHSQLQILTWLSSHWMLCGWIKSTTHVHT